MTMYQYTADTSLDYTRWALWVWLSNWRLYPRPGNVWVPELWIWVWLVRYTLDYSCPMPVFCCCSFRRLLMGTVPLVHVSLSLGAEIVDRGCKGECSAVIRQRDSWRLQRLAADINRGISNCISGAQHYLGGNAAPPLIEPAQLVVWWSYIWFWITNLKKNIPCHLVVLFYLFI